MKGPRPTEQRPKITKGARDQRIKGSRTGTKGPGDQDQAIREQRSKEVEDQGTKVTKGPRDQRTKGPKDQGTKGPRDQRTKGPKDHGTRDVQGTRKSNANQKNRIYKQQSEIVGSFLLIAKKVFS